MSIYIAYIILGAFGFAWLMIALDFWLDLLEIFSPLLFLGALVWAVWRVTQ